MALDFTKSNSASQLKKIQQKSVENGNKIVAIDLPIDQIDENEMNKSIFNMNDIDFLAERIDEGGFAGAIEVYKKPDGRYEISAGHRRVAAMKRLKKKTVPAIVKEMPDDFTRLKNLLASNIHNRQLTPLEKARMIKAYEDGIKEQWEKEGKKDWGKKTELKNLSAKFFNISPAQAYRFECIAVLIPELQELTNDPLFPYSALRAAATLSEENQKELFKQIEFLMKDIGEGEQDLKLSRPKIEQMITVIKENEERKNNPEPERVLKQEPVPIHTENNEEHLQKDFDTSNEYSQKNDLEISNEMKKEFGISSFEENEKIDTGVGYPKEISLDELKVEKKVEQKPNISDSMINYINEIDNLCIGQFYIREDAKQECIDKLQMIINKIKESGN